MPVLKSLADRERDVTNLALPQIAFGPTDTSAKGRCRMLVSGIAEGMTTEPPQPTPQEVHLNGWMTLWRTAGFGDWDSTAGTSDSIGNNVVNMYHDIHTQFLGDERLATARQTFRPSADE
jgi:hypothetical protein